MLRMCRPRKVLEDGTLVWWDDDEPKKQALYAYCQQDVRVERSISSRVRRLSPQERRIYLLDQRINDRGVLLDRSLALAGRGIVERALRPRFEVGWYAWRCGHQRDLSVSCYKKRVEPCCRAWTRRQRDLLPRSAKT